jgi:hypothetical protein
MNKIIQMDQKHFFLAELAEEDASMNSYNQTVSCEMYLLSFPKLAFKYVEATVSSVSRTKM